MRIRILLLLLLSSLPVRAQVSVDQRALDALAPAKPTSPAPAPAAKPAPAAAKPANTGTASKPVTPVAPNVAEAPPPNANLPPPIAVPTRPASPVSPPPVAADAPTRTEPLKSATGNMGIRVVFGAGRSDINPATETAIRTLVHGDQTQPPAPQGASFTITCFAAGTPEDPSSPRRLSLSRALAVRSVLISQGVPSVRIYVRAFGPASPGFADGPPDRADVVVGANPVTPSQPTPTKS
jgi:outer membrane protein OmpA-like peptidoglycan-associated protein